MKGIFKGFIKFASHQLFYRPLDSTKVLPISKTRKCGKYIHWPSRIVPSFISSLKYFLLKIGNTTKGEKILHLTSEEGMPFVQTISKGFTNC